MTHGDVMRAWLDTLATWLMIERLDYVSCRRGDMFLEFDGETLTASVGDDSWTLRASDLDEERFEVAA